MQKTYSCPFLRAMPGSSASHIQIIVALHGTFEPSALMRSKSASRPTERACSVSVMRKYAVCSGRHVLSYCSRKLAICKVNAQSYKNSTLISILDTIRCVPMCVCVFIRMHKKILECDIGNLNDNPK